jgi:hypothetical protein
MAKFTFFLKLARIAWSIQRNEKTFDLNRHEVMAI